ncbi:MAG: AAA family ATPase [Moraxellaceae bacterium]|nr:AAA family ATPase [Pseudobdellovibrionaceae bacterium]
MTSTIIKDEIQLSDEQQVALDLLKSGDNVFLTGGAGSGKSFVVRELMKELDSESMPILASTGAAAVLLGGRTFHSFFGIGIMEGGFEATVTRGLKDKKLLKRLAKVDGVVIDEISMIPGEALAAAEYLSQMARESTLPWGGMRVIAVGDFGQLPPVTMAGKKRDWCFQHEVWKKTNFLIYQLKYNQRVQESEYLEVLDQIRRGKLDDKGRNFLNSRVRNHDEDEPGTRLFPRREQSEFYNQKKLKEINQDEFAIPSIYFGEEKFITSLKKNAPVAEELKLKKDCRVLFLKNDAQKRYVNGTRGTVVEIESDHIIVKKDLRDRAGFGREIKVEKMQFSLLDPDGNIKASVIQFPLALAYATTIHKSQGATIDELWCDLSSLWEPGQAYVALSRLRDSSGLHIVRWSERSIITDPAVSLFYSQIDPI